MRRTELGLWIAVGVVLCGLAVPWFLWGSATVVAGLPLWLWWHVAWMGVASLVFWLFTRNAWGIGIDGVENGTGPSDGDPNGPDRARDARAGGEPP